MTVAGTFASHYFTTDEKRKVKNPTLGAARRAFTYSFGTIAFGSAIVALIQTARFILRHIGLETEAKAIKEKRQRRGWTRWFNPITWLEAILLLMEKAISYCNFYAFSYVAIWGKPFIKSSRSAWNLLSHQGMTAIVNDVVVGMILSFISERHNRAK